MDEKSLLIQNNFVLTALFFFQSSNTPSTPTHHRNGGRGLGTQYQPSHLWVSKRVFEKEIYGANRYNLQATNDRAVKQRPINDR